MYIKKRIVEKINSLLSPFDIEIARKSRLDRIRKFYEPSFNRATLSYDAKKYLNKNNPRLKELKKKYNSSKYEQLRKTAWTNHLIERSLDLQFFRGDNPYMYQFRDRNTEGTYLLTMYYVSQIDSLNLLSLLDENDLFGVYTFNFNGFTVSRDLLDSIVEIYFLENALRISNLSNINVLDIGAGYGRLAYRMVKALPKIGKVFCVDAIPESTFICEYYLRFCGVDKKAIVVPLDEIEDILANNNIYLATNICSFSECYLEAISSWLDLLRKYNVRYLMVVPDAYQSGGKKLLTTGHDGYLDFLPAINSRGYKLIIKQPKYLDPFIQKYGVTPTYHYLFELSN